MKTWDRTTEISVMHPAERCQPRQAPGPRGREVPDPYYGGDAGFERVLDMLEAAADGLVARLRQG